MVEAREGSLSQPTSESLKNLSTNDFQRTARQARKNFLRGVELKLNRDKIQLFDSYLAYKLAEDNATPEVKDKLTALAIHQARIAKGEPSFIERVGKAARDEAASITKEQQGDPFTTGDWTKINFPQGGTQLQIPDIPDTLQSPKEFGAVEKILTQLRTPISPDSARKMFDVYEQSYRQYLHDTDPRISPTQESELVATKMAHLKDGYMANNRLINLMVRQSYFLNPSQRERNQNEVTNLEELGYDPRLAGTDQGLPSFGAELIRLGINPPLPKGENIKGPNNRYSYNRIPDLDIRLSRERQTFLMDENTLQQFQTRLNLVFGPGFTDEEKEQIRREQEAIYAERGLKLLRENPPYSPENDFDQPDTSKMKILQEFDEYLHDHYIQKLRKLGISTTHLQHSSTVLTREFVNKRRKRGGDPHMRGGFAHNGLAIVALSQRVAGTNFISKVDTHYLAHAQAHEQSHNSIPEAIVVRKNIFGKATYRHVPSLPPILQEGLAEWDQKEVAHDLHGSALGEELSFHQSEAPEKTHVEEKLFPDDSLDLDFLKEQRGNALTFELMITRKIAGLLAYYAEENPLQASDDELIAKGRAMLEKLEYSPDLNKNKKLKRLLKGIAEFTTASDYLEYNIAPIMSLFETKAHTPPPDTRMRKVLTAIHRAEKAIGRAF